MSGAPGAAAGQAGVEGRPAHLVHVASRVQRHWQHLFWVDPSSHCVHRGLACAGQIAGTSLCKPFRALLTDHDFHILVYLFTF